MTYSYVHIKINEEAFPNRLMLYDKELMTGRGMGKYWYKEALRKKGEEFFKENLKKYFPKNDIIYII
jgi:spore photoproduct lyase